MEIIKNNGEIPKELYKIIADKHNTTYCCVERNIRTAIQAGWKNNKNYMMSLFKIHLYTYPAPLDFLSAMYQYAEYDMNK